jgi:Mg-chelatase subunit ChlD
MSDSSEPEDEVNLDQNKERAKKAWFERRAQRKMLVERPYNNTDLATSYTDGAVRDWTSQHGVRELVQNLVDGTRRTFGNRGKGLIIYWNADTEQFEIKRRVDNLVVATIDTSEPNVLRIVQQEIALYERHLKINSVKTEEE